MKPSDHLSQDDALLQELVLTVLHNLENEQFGVEDLSEQIGMSRSHLHRKLKMLKGKSVSQFIREIRLEEAMKLLKNDTATAAEIAYRVGFNSTSYFHKCFHEHYGFSPGDIKKRNLGEGSTNHLNLPSKKEEVDRPIYFRKANHLSIKKLVPPALALVFAFVAGYFLFTWQSDAKSTPQKSIAVLPLDNLTVDDGQGYQAAGLHDALIGELGKIAALRVISKTSVLHFPDKNMLIQEIAQELNVDGIVEGSVFVKDDSLHIRIQLIEPFPVERHLWSQEYRGHIRQVLSLQNEIVRDIARAIEIEVTPEEEVYLANARTMNPETYKAYVRGMYYVQKSTREDRKKGLAFLHQAVDKDPADPMAWTGLALGYIEEGHSSTASDDAFLRAKAAAMQALKLDSTLLEAHAALGRIQLYYEWDWEGAEKTFRYVNKANPSMATNHYHYSWYLHLMGRKGEAIREHELAQKYDPLGVKNTGWLGWLYAYYGDFQQAEREIEKTFELDSTYHVGFWAQGLIKEKEGKYEETIKIYKQLTHRHPNFKWLLGCAYARAGKTLEARKILAALERSLITPWNANGLSRLYAALGENDKAFEWLRYKPHHAYIPWVRVDLFNDSLRKDPRFHTLMAEMNLPPVTMPAEASL